MRIVTRIKKTENTGIQNEAKKLTENGVNYIKLKVTDGLKEV